MQKQIQKTFKTLVAGLVLSSGLLMAQKNTQPEVTAATVTAAAAAAMVSKAKAASTTKNTELLNLAGEQRMLSQRIAKNYFYKGMHINTTKASKQLEESLAQFNQSLEKINRQITDKKVKKMIRFVDMSKNDFMSIDSSRYDLENGALVLDLSESMLEGSQYIVKFIKASSPKQSSALIDLAGRQRMLSQRIAKYYISYKAGIKDKNSIDQMKKTVEEFTEAHGKLMNNKTNSAEINAQLQKVDKLWEIVYDFYLDVEEGDLPVIVYNTTDNIMKEMNIVTKMYVDLQN